MGKDGEQPLIASFSEWYSKLNRRDCDGFDRLSNRHTIAMLVAASAVLALKSYMSDSIDCWVPAEFKANHDNHVKYTDNYCWVKNTYYIPNTARLPGPEGIPEDVGGKEIKYYQWVPIIISFMIFMFTIPARFWGFSMWMSGYNVEKLILMVTKDENVDPEKRDKTTAYVTAQMTRHIGFQRALGRTEKVPLGSSYGKFLTIMYIVTKIIYCAIPVCIIFLLGAMMGPGYHDYGIRAINGLMHDNGDYIENPMFPRKAICNFVIRGLGQNFRRYTAECVLPVNLFNDKIFLLIWWWLLILACLSFVGLLNFLITNRPGGGISFVEKYLHIMKVADPESESDSADIKRFTEDYLNSDGVLCLRLIALNTMDVVAAEIVGQLYTQWNDGKSSLRKED